MSKKPLINNDFLLTTRPARELYHGYAEQMLVIDYHCHLPPAGGATGSDLITTVAGVYDILFGMRRCRIKLPNRCYHLISRVAHRAMTKDGGRRIERVAPL